MTSLYKQTKTDKTDNELIAEFMGMPTIPDPARNNELKWDFQGSNKLIFCISSHELKYRTSWDWLMPVVEKIESLGHDTNINGFTLTKSHRCSIEHKDFGYHQFSHNAQTKIEAVYKAVIQIIEWYDQQKTSS